MTISMSPPQSQPASQTESYKVVAFHISGHWLALPTSAVLKITRFPTGVNNGVEGVRLKIWNNSPLVYLNLHSLLSPKQNQLFPIPDGQTSGSSELVIIARSRAAETCAIPVTQSPTLMEIPVSDIKVLPPHYHQAIQGIAEHVAVLSHQGSVLNILLLNLQQALDKTLQEFQRGI